MEIENIARNITTGCSRHRKRAADLNVMFLEVNMINNNKNTIYRNCLDDIDGNCPYMYLNKYGIACCRIDKIIQVEFYGCVPQEIIDKTKAKHNTALEPTYTTEPLQDTE